MKRQYDYSMNATSHIKLSPTLVVFVCLAIFSLGCQKQSAYTRAGDDDDRIIPTERGDNNREQWTAAIRGAINGIRSLDDETVQASVGMGRYELINAIDAVGKDVSSLLESQYRTSLLYTRPGDSAEDRTIQLNASLNAIGGIAEVMRNVRTVERMAGVLAAEPNNQEVRREFANAVRDMRGAPNTELANLLEDRHRAGLELIAQRRALYKVIEENQTETANEMIEEMGTIPRVRLPGHGPGIRRTRIDDVLSGLSRLEKKYTDLSEQILGALRTGEMVRYHEANKQLFLLLTNEDTKMFMGDIESAWITSYGMAANAVILVDILPKTVLLDAVYPDDLASITTGADIQTD